MSCWRGCQSHHCPSLYRQESLRRNHAHTATINTVDKGKHAPLGREDEGDADPAPDSDIEMRTVGPDRDRDRGSMQVCPSPTFSCVRAYIRQYQSLTSPDFEMRADHSHDEDPVQVRASLFPFHMYAYSTPHDRTSHYTRAPPGVPHHLYLHVARQKHSSSSPHPPSLPPARRNGNWDPDPLDVISVASSSDSPPPPLRRSAQEQDADATVHGTYPCTVPPTRCAQIRLCRGLLSVHGSH